MDESSAVDELRMSGHHLFEAVRRVVTGLREAANIVAKRTGLTQSIARARESRMLQTARRRLRELSPRATVSPEQIGIVLRQRLPVSHEEFDELIRRIERLEERLAERAA
jgi:hypothetical protein